MGEHELQKERGSVWSLVFQCCSSLKIRKIDEIWHTGFETSRSE